VDLIRVNWEGALYGNVVWVRLGVGVWVCKHVDVGVSSNKLSIRNLLEQRQRHKKGARCTSKEHILPIGELNQG